MMPLTGVPVGGLEGGSGRRRRSAPNRSLSWFTAARDHLRRGEDVTARQARQGSPSPRPLCLVALLCPTLCDPMDHNPPGSSVRGLLQARILEWVAAPFSRESSQPRNLTQVSCISHQLSYQGNPIFLYIATRSVSQKS